MPTVTPPAEPRTDGTTIGIPVRTMRTTAFVAGALYLLTFVTSIPTLALFASVHDPAYVLGAGPDTGVHLGAVLNVLCALAGIGTAVALNPILKRHNESLAIGFVASRVVEGALILLGVASLLSVVTLRHSGADPTALTAGAGVLVAVHDWAFVLGQSLMPVVNALMLGTALYRSRLVPRLIPALGLIGAPLLFASVIGTIFGAFPQSSILALFAGLPIAVWEFSLGVWLVVRGFRTSRPTPTPAL
ncbi:DUF4386 domain-containing protein [Pseudonocardia xishanensis]|uniref:DUF4386 domain-containing protein n=1 Tax=Pseudonocardia xishanensis TaxID=630995 RepID=A0ABP8RII6_9PSEU